MGSIDYTWGELRVLRQIQVLSVKACFQEKSYQNKEIRKAGEEIFFLRTITMDMDHEVNLLKEEITRLGSKDESTGDIVVEFGVLFADDKCANLFEALVGTLRAAKKRKVIDFKGEMLFQGVHDKVPIKLLASA